MKRYIILLLFILGVLSCKKEPELQPQLLEITSVEINATTSKAIINATYTYPTVLKSAYLKISIKQDMSSADNYLITIDGNTLSVEIYGLNVATKYYYCFEYNNGIKQATTTIMNFITPDYSLPIVNTKDVLNVTSTTAECGGEVINDGESAVTARGVCWSTSHNPTTNNNHTSNGTGLGEFSVSITGLNTNVTYYIRAYATNTKGTAYGEERSFTTQEGLAVISTSEVTNITSISALSGGNIIDDGGFEITARGICWSTNQYPTINNVHTTDGSGIGDFISNMIDLQTDTKYYVRAYATNSKGTNYGIQKEFTTLDGLPTVTIMDITNITAISASCGGDVIDDGGFDISAKGICWSTHQNPTIYDFHTNDGTGTGAFISDMSNLQINTKYYIRTYATNIKGTSYSESQEFTTMDGLPSITTYDISDITATSATCGGVVTDDGGFDVIARGICWSSSQNPTTSNSYTSDGIGIGEYTSFITNLNSQTKYYVRAYATNINGTRYGELKVFFATDYPGSIGHGFSIDENYQVYFSQGNLQYQASTNTWRFAENQYDYIGDDNQNISSNYGGYIDMFGWGTSGYNHGAVCYQPWSTNTNNGNYWAYGSITYNLRDQTCHADWGYNAISNGGNAENMWRTLSNVAWKYIFQTRSTTSGIRYAKAIVNGVNGIILLPDDWSTSYYSLNNPNVYNASYNTNIISVFIWNDYLEAHGAVFLPAAGLRNETSIIYIGTDGQYWCNNRVDDGIAYVVSFNDSELCHNMGVLQYRCYGLCVRLVTHVFPTKTE